MSRISALLVVGLLSFGLPLAAGAANRPDPRTAWARSAAAVSSVERVHAEGTLRLTGKNQATTTFAFNSDCDWGGQEGRLRLHLVAPKAGTSYDVIVIGNAAWDRSSQTGDVWQSNVRGTEGLLTQLLIPDVLLQARYVTGPTRVRAAHPALVGPDTVGGRPVWHLRLTWKQDGDAYRLDVYADQTSGLWLRKTTQVRPRSSGSNTSVLTVNTLFSRFNNPVTIQPPDLSQIPPGASPSFDLPGGIEIAPDGTVVVADGRNARVVRLSPEGKLLALMPLDLHNQSQPTEPLDVAVDKEGDVYVAFWLQDRVLKLNPKGTVIGTINTGIGGAGGLDQWGAASTVALDQAGNLWVGYMDGRVREYTGEGELLRSWQRPGDFYKPEPTDLAIASNGTMYFTGETVNTIQVLSPNGELLQTWGRHGSALGEFDTPKKVAVDQAGNVYVVDMGNERVQKLSQDGRPLAAWPAGPFKDEDGASGIAVEPSGNVYVAGTQQVQKFAPDGRLLATWGTSP